MYCLCLAPFLIIFFFFFNDTATTEIYTLSLHDALPIFLGLGIGCKQQCFLAEEEFNKAHGLPADRKSTRLNSSHVRISYAVFCLKKKKNTRTKSLESHACDRPGRRVRSDDGTRQAQVAA